MSKTKQIVAEIVGDGKLFDEGLHEEHMRGHGDQKPRQRPDASRQAREDHQAGPGVASPGETETPTNSASA
jgi:hypothetical protein